MKLARVCVCVYVCLRIILHAPFYERVHSKYTLIQALSYKCDRDRERENEKRWNDNSRKNVDVFENN